MCFQDIERKPNYDGRNDMQITQIQYISKRGYKYNESKFFGYNIFGINYYYLKQSQSVKHPVCSNLLAACVLDRLNMVCTIPGN